MLQICYPASAGNKLQNMTENSIVQQKICLLGDFGVGKTSLVRRFVEGKFSDKYLTTIGVNISRKEFQVGATRLTYLLWDFNGGAKFDHMLTSYCTGSMGAIIVADLGRAETFDKLEYYAAEFRKLRPQGKLIFVGNKADLPLADQRISAAQIEATATKYTTPYFLTSAKSGALVEELFLKMGQLTLSK